MDTLSQQLAKVQQRVKTLEGKGGRGLPRDEEGRIRLPGEVIIGDPDTGVILVPDRPAPPAGVTVTPGAFADRVFADVAWNARDGAAGYEVVLRRVSTGTVDVKTPTGTSVRFDGLAPNEQYGATVYSVDNLGRASDPSPEVTFDSGQDTTDPSQVAGLIVMAGVRSLLARWTDNPDEDVANGVGWYEVQVATNATFTGDVWSERTSSTAIGITDRTAGTTYHVRVRAIDSSANVGPWSTTVTVVAGRVTGGDLDAPDVEATLVPLLIADEAFLIQLTAADAFIANLEVDMLNVTGDLSASRISSGSITAAAITIGSGGSIQIVGQGQARLRQDNTGLRMWNTDNIRTVFLDARTGDVELRGRLLAGSVMTDGDIVGATVTGGVVAGALVQASDIIGTRYRTSVSGARVQIDDNNDRITFFNSSGVSSNLRQGNSLGLETSGSLRVGATSDQSVGGGTVYCARVEARDRIESPEYRANIDVMEFVTINDSGVTTRVRVATLPGGTRAFEPGGVDQAQDATIMLGRNVRRWDTVFTQNGVVATSDVRAKPGVVDLDRDRAAAVARNLRLVTWPDDGGRAHLGFDARQLDTAATRHGMDLAAVHRPDDPDELLGLNYQELLPLLAAWIGDIESRHDDRLTALEGAA